MPNPKFERRHYNAIADVFRNCAMVWERDPAHSLREIKTLTYLARDFATLLARDNPRFDKERFMDACFPGDAEFEVTPDGVAELKRRELT